MSTSTIVKILLAVFLGAFLWFVIVSIQTPKQQSAATTRQALREELVNRSVNVNVRVGNLVIIADTAEEFRNGEVHYRDFQITQETDKRTITVAGKVARTRSRGTEVDFVEMEGNIRVESSDGLNLSSRTLNYESAQKRIFSNDSARFSINELSGRSDRFIYFTEKSLLDLQGAVRCKMNVDEEGEEKPAESETEEDKPERQKVNLYAEQVLYDQQAHSVALIDSARVAQAGSYVLGDRIDAKLTDDNSQFTEILVNDPTVKDVPEEGDGEAAETADVTTAEEGAESPEPAGRAGSLSHHAGGIKDLKAQRLRLVFAVGEDNLLSRVEAQENARLDIAPTVAQILAGKTEVKKIRGQNIEGTLGEDGKGIKKIVISSTGGEQAEIEIKPYRRALRRVANADSEEIPARTMRADRFNINVDPETNEFTMINMNGKVQFNRGDLTLTSETARYETEAEKIEISGNPVLRDSAKRVSGKRMVVSLDIGDLEASDGTVETLFYPPKEGAADPGIFAIGAKISETVVSSGSLRFDYQNNILRYGDGVRISQGDTIINCDKLDIDQKNERLTALGDVSAALAFRREGEEEPQAVPETAEETADEGRRERGNRRRNNGSSGDSSPLLHLTGNRLVIDKQSHEVRIVSKAQSIQGELTLAADEIVYKLSEEDTLLESTAKSNVRVNIGGITIFGEVATLYMGEQLLLVEGKNVRYVDVANNTESSHSKLTYDLKDGSMRLDARADQLVRTRISR